MGKYGLPENRDETQWKIGTDLDGNRLESQCQIGKDRNGKGGIARNGKGRLPAMEKTVRIAVKDREAGTNKNGELEKIEHNSAKKV